MTRGSSFRWVWGGGAVVALGLFVAAGWLAEGDAAGHARLHAATAIVLLLLAGAIRGRWQDAGIASLAPRVGLSIFALAQLIEGVGALGYDATNSVPASNLADLHDVGLAVTPIGLIATFVGVAIALVTGVGRQGGAARWVAATAAVAVVVGGLFVVKTAIGM